MTVQSSLSAPLTVRVISTAASDSLCDITEGPAVSPHIHSLHSALKMQNDRHEDLWNLSVVIGILVCIFSCFVWHIVLQFHYLQIHPNKESEMKSVCCKDKSDKLQLSVALLRERSCDLLPAAPPGRRNTSPLHWQEAHRLTPPVALTGGVPYKEVKYFPTDKCVYPPITAYHKLAAPGPCMGRTSATLQKGSVVVWSTLQDL